MSEPKMLSFAAYDELMHTKGGVLPRDSDAVKYHERFFSKDRKSGAKYIPQLDCFTIDSMMNKQLSYEQVATDPVYLSWGPEMHGELIRACIEARTTYLASRQGQAQKILEAMGVNMALAYKLVNSSKVSVWLDNGEGWSHA